MTTAVIPEIGAATRIAVTHQKCPRRRYLEFHLLGQGIEPVYLDPASTTAHWIARGIESLLTGGETQSAIRIILFAFAQEFSARGIDPVHGDPFTLYTEQAALIEAVLRGYARAVVEGMLLKFEPLDGNMLRDRQTGRVMSHVVRVVADADRDQIVRDTHSLYTVARGAHDFVQWHALYDGLWLQYVVVGDRRQRGGETIRTQRTPFITGYRSQVGGRLSPTATRTDARTGRKARLGNDYKLFHVWDNRSPVTLEQWIAMLDGWGQFAELFKSVQVNPPQESEGDEALQTVEDQNSIVLPGAPVEIPYLLSLFPMYRHSCDFPKICPYQQLDCCYGDIPVTDPTRGGVYRRKENHEHSSSPSQ